MPGSKRDSSHSIQVTPMFHTPIDTRSATPLSFDRFAAFSDKPLRFPADRDLCRERVPAPVVCDATRLAAEARKSTSRQAFKANFTAADWRTFTSFCIVRRLPAGARVLIPGQIDRTLRFVVEGSLWQEPAPGARATAGRPKLVLAGAILGEDAVFSDGPCELDARTVEDAVILELSLPRQKELTASCPRIAFELLRAAGAVIAARGRTSQPQDELAAS